MENLLLAVPIWVSSCPTATIFRRACELAFTECHTGGKHCIYEQEVCLILFSLVFPFIYYTCGEGLSCVLGKWIAQLGDSIKPAIPNMDEFEVSNRHPHGFNGHVNLIHTITLEK
ncbi:hypothetical protein LOK49_Contig543G00001 [Camellia lanceoleosa]|nr:hypothetical protein LOK49_Contig543G00001 [Camellia lanceoleosa]